MFGQLLGGAWYHCTVCGFAGDSIQLFQAARRIPKLVDAVVGLGKSIAALQQSKDMDVIKYLTAQTEQQLVNDFWAKARNRLLDLDVAGQTLLQQYGLYAGYPWRITPPVGVAAKADIEALPRGPTVKGNMLVIPFQELPGLITGFYLLGNRFEHVYLLDNAMKDERAWFLFNSWLRPDNHKVIAVNNPLLALQLHVRHQQATGQDNLPVVAWAPGLNLKWYAHRVANLLLCSETEDSDVCSQLVTCCTGMPRTAYGLMPRVNTPLDLAQMLDETGYARLIQSWNDVSSPSTIKGTQMIPVQPVEERGLDFNSAKILDRADGWYTQIRGKVTKISDVKLIPRQIFRFVNSDRVVCKGDLDVSGRSVPFETDVQNLLDVSRRWIQTWVVKQTGEAPAVNKQWYKHLYAIGTKLYNPVVSEVREGIGWDAAKCVWTTPRYNIGADGIAIVDSVCDVTQLAGGRLPLMDVKQFKDLSATLEDDTATAGAWAYILVVVYNILAKRMNWPMVGLGLMSETLDDHYLGRWAQSGLHIPGHHLARNAKTTKLLEEYKAESLPCALECTAACKYEDTLKLLNCRVYANVLAALPVDAWHVRGLYPNWVMFPNQKTQPPTASMWAAVPLLLQSCVDMSSDRMTYRSVAILLGAWATGIGENMRRIHFRALDILGATGSPTTSAAKLILGLFFRLAIDMKYNPVRDSEGNRRLFKITQSMDGIHLNLRTLSGVLARRGYPLPTWTVIVQSVADDNGLVRSEPQLLTLKREWWDAFVKETTATMVSEGYQEAVITQLLDRLLSVCPASQPAPDTSDESASSTPTPD